MREPLAWAGTALAAAMLAGCSTTDAHGGASSPPQPSASTAAAARTHGPRSTPTPAGPSGGVLELHNGQPVDLPSEPVWDNVSRTAAIDAAVAAMTAFARPELPYEQWWAAVGPTMSVPAQIDYQYVDPANVPAHAVTGPGALVDQTSASVASVLVPTDVGPYTVVVSRADTGAAWLVERITPSDGDQ